MPYWCQLSKKKRSKAADRSYGGVVTKHCGRGGVLWEKKKKKKISHIGRAKNGAAGGMGW